jgi:hypothetical protein
MKSESKNQKAEMGYGTRCVHRESRPALFLIFFLLSDF